MGEMSARSGWLRWGERAVPVRIRMPLRAVTGGLVIVPPVGFEYAIAHRTVISLAEHAARAGFLTYVFPLAGDCDSQFPEDSSDLVEIWHEEVRAVLNEVIYRLPGGPVSLLAMRLGATLIPGLDRRSFARTIMWEPVSGKRFLKQQALRRAMDTQVAVTTEGREVETYGRLFSPRQAESIRRLIPPLVDSRIETIHRGSRAWFENADFSSTTPAQEIRRIVSSLPCGQPTGILNARDSGTVVLPGAGGPAVVETFVEVGPHRLSGIVSRSQSTSAIRGLALFSAQGPEQRCGPGGLWASAARELAQESIVSLRLDRRGQGDHTDAIALYPPNPYTKDGISDVVEGIRYLRNLSAAPCVGFSSCAGAWLMLRAARQVPLDSVVGMSLTYFGNDLEWLGTREAELWLGLPGTEVSPDLPRSRWSLNRYLWGLARRLRASFVREFSSDWREAIATGSAGLPALRPTKGRPPIVLLFSGRDSRRFLHLGGGMLRKNLAAFAFQDVDHSLLTSAARVRVLDFIRANCSSLFLNDADTPASGRSMYWRTEVAGACASVHLESDGARLLALGRRDG